MTPAEQFLGTLALAADYPSGTTVYHRASGARGTVVGYVTYYDGSCRIMVEWVHNTSYDFVMACSISLERVPDDDAYGSEA